MMLSTWVLLITLAGGQEVEFAQYSTKEYCQYRALDFKQVSVKARCVERK